ncbi:MAG: porin family protein [Spirochaetaceae bacterium]|nr:porin family protein [Spirochaetaceae bacterium]
MAIGHRAARIALIIVIFLLFSFLVFAEESSVSLRIAPVMDIPSLPQFDIIIGGNSLLDWSFLSFSKFYIGVSAGVGFMNVPVKVGEPFSFLDFKAGPFVRYRFFDRWAAQASFYAGIYKFNRGEAGYTKSFASFSMGVDFYISPYLSVFAEGGYTHRIFDEIDPFTSVGASIGMRFNISELMGGRARINVDKSKQYRVFPVSWAWYEKNPVAEVVITNEEINDITNVNLSFFLDSYMGQPFTFASLSRLSSGESAEVPVTALFNEVMLGLTENVNANGVLQIHYQSLGAKKEAVFPLQMPIFHRNTMSWDDDRRAAAFVSPKDSAARLFARYVASAVNLHLESGKASPRLMSVPKNVRYAVAMFEALRLYGLSYVVVPSLSFVNMRADESALDNLTYPYETLYYRGGDCTYISILYCSLLEALNIETAFITVPGHLYMAFEVGDDNWMATSQNIIEIDGRRWLPIEITVPEEGFNRAWRIGALQWTRYGDEADIFPIRECWKVYPSVTVSASVDYPPEMPLIIDIIKAMEAELLR